MIDKKHIESVLKVNGIGSTAPDEQIRSVLLSARFNNDEVETALVVLRENTTTSETRVDGLHKVFRSDQTLKSSEISQLLGIDVDIDATLTEKISKQRFTILQLIILWFISLIFALTAVLFYMYSHNMGLFHPSAGIAFHP